MAAACPSDDRIAAFVEGALRSDDAAALRAHLDGCEACAELVADYAEAFGLPSADQPSTHPPSQVGDAGERGPDLDLHEGDMFDRYVVLMLAGRGGMGEVYVAYDPTLDRKLALKIVRPSRTPDESAQERLLAEARRAAAVTHDNLVPIYDVGFARGRAYIAMEYVEGPSLAQWLRTDSPTPTQIVDVFVGAARGLAAAHDAGIVHRDFKPANVLLGRDGRPRVTDFGLARALDDDDEAPGAAGTPAYMAPEQWAGRAVDARADQYAFGVALFEALHGRRPPRADADTGVDASDPLAPHHVIDTTTTRPTPYDALLRRCLRARPDDRFATMHEVIAALAPRRRARTAWVLAAAGLVGVATWIAWSPPAPPRRCAGRDRMDAIVTSESMAAVRAGLERTHADFARVAAGQTVQALGRYAAGWTAAYDETCHAPAAPQVRGCLRQAEDELVATIDVLRDADETSAARAVSMVRELPEPRECLDRADERSDRFAPAATIAEVESLEAQVNALRRAGRYEEALVIAQRALSQAQASGHTATLARAEFSIGMLQLRRTEDEDAAVHLERAAWLASRVSDDEIHVQALASLIGLEGGLLRRPERARQWAQRARTALRAAGSPPRLRQSLLLAEGGFAALVGEDRRAIALLEEATAIAEALYGDDHHLVARPLQGLGIARFNQGDLVGARRDVERAVAINEAALGPVHPELTKSLDVLAAIAGFEGKRDEAVTIAERSLQIAIAAHGPDALRTAQEHHHLAIQLDDAERFEEASVHILAAIAGMEAAGGPYEHSLQNALDALGLVRFHQDRYEPAVAAFERSIAIAEHNGEGDSIDTASAWSHLGETFRWGGRMDDAVRAHERALGIRERYGRPHYVAATLSALARVARDRGDWASARAFYEDAAGHWEAAYGPEHPFVQRARGSMVEMEQK